MTYGHASPDEPVQLVNLRVSAVGRLDGLALGRALAGATDARRGRRRPRGRRTSRRPASRRARCCRADALAPGAERAGPLIVEAVDTTIVVPPGWRLRAGTGGFIVLEARPCRPIACVSHRSRHLRGGQERALRRRRGDEGGPGQDRLLAAPQGGRRLFVRALRRARRDGGAGAGPAHSSRLHAARRQGGHPGLAARFAAGRRLHPQRSLLRRQPPARRQRGHARLPRGHPARLRLRARALAGHRQRHARAATAPPPRSTARACACRRCGSTRPASSTADVERIIFTNVRTPDERRGDLRAQMAANQRGVPRLQELARKHGVARLLAIMQEVMDYSERMMRADARRAARRHRDLRGLLRRRRHHRERRQGGPHLPDPHARRPSAATASPWTSRAPTRRCRGR